MVKAVAEFLVGAAVILTPQYQVPLLLGSAALKVGSTVARQHKKGQDEEKDMDNNGQSSTEQLQIEWQDLSVAIGSKKAKSSTPVFEGLEGRARPGR